MFELEELHILGYNIVASSSRSQHTQGGSTILCKYKLSATALDDVSAMSAEMSREVCAAVRFKLHLGIDI